MSRWTPELATRLLLGPGGAVELDRPDGAADAAPAADFSTWCAAHRGARCELLLSTRWLTLTSVDPALGLQQRSELAAHARAQLLQVHGTEAEDWPLLPWPGGVSALSGVPLPALLQTAAQHRVRIEGVQPLWAAAWPLLVQPALAQQWLLLQEGDSVTVLQIDHGRPVRVLQRRCAAGPLDAPAAADALQALRLSCGMPFQTTPTLLQLPGALCQLLPGRSTRPAPQDDFRGLQPSARLPWLAAAAAALVALVAITDALQAWQDSQAAQAEWQALQTLPTRAPATAEPVAASTEPARQQALLLAWRHDWRGVFEAVEAASMASTASAQGLRWLAFEHDASAGVDGGALRLQGLAPDLATVQRAAQALTQRDGTREALLTHVQTEGRGLRFELRAAGSGR